MKFTAQGNVRGPGQSLGVLFCDQIADREDDQSSSTATALGRVNDNGRLSHWIAGGKGPIFHGAETQPCLSGRAQFQFMDKRLPTNLPCLG